MMDNEALIIHDGGVERVSDIQYIVFDRYTEHPGPWNYPAYYNTAYIKRKDGTVVSILFGLRDKEKMESIIREAVHLWAKGEKVIDLIKIAESLEGEDE